jgi:integrase
VQLWAEQTTSSASTRRSDLLRDKIRVVMQFFAFAARPPWHITPFDVTAWQRSLEQQGLRASTVYASVSRVSSFYEWLAQHTDQTGDVVANPVRLARPKAPRPYQSQRTRALSDEEVRALLRVMRERAASGSLSGLRDYALLLLLLLTGMRRQELALLRREHLTFDEHALTITISITNGTLRTRTISEPALRTALLDYLHASGRDVATMPGHAPLWLAHDRATGALAAPPPATGKPLTSHSLARNLKRYAAEAGIVDFHLHQTRHTYARIVSELSGSLAETQAELGLRSPRTTHLYVQRVADPPADPYSRDIAGRWEVGDGA